MNPRGTVPVPVSDSNLKASAGTPASPLVATGSALVVVVADPAQPTSSTNTMFSKRYSLQGL